MSHHISRRTALQALLAVPAVATLSPATAEARPVHAVQPGCRHDVSAQLAGLEQKYQARVGVFARNLRDGATVRHRSNELFPMLSTFKVLASAHVLRDFDHDGRFLARTIHYTAADLVVNSPITSQHVDTGMTVGELCAAAIQYSDNTAGNLILGQTGGPRSIGRFARSLGDRTTRLDRWEPSLNTAIPGDPRDTTTPESLGRDYAGLIVGRRLNDADRAQLTTWLKGNTTSTHRFRAGLPAGWVLADKTGSGDYGTANDIGVAWTPCGTPVLLSVQTRKAAPDAVAADQLLADIARLLACSLVRDE